ncbi:MAG: hypothetical protein HYS75_02960 [Nitrosopumilales archaeon]|nr:hypothetical protein [Nitrosopumilales archaeon]
MVMGLQPSEILTINGMIITGLLILTTIGTTASLDASYNRFLAAGALMIIPFAVSACLQLDKMIEKWNWREGICWMFGGFVFLLIMVGKRIDFRR